MRADRAVRRSDLILIAALALISVLLLIIPAVTAVRPDSPALLIRVDGKEYGTYPLTEDREIKINDTNVCEIRSGKVRMISADCPDKICLREKAIGDGGGSIVCLPNRIVLSIVNAENAQGREGGTLDGIAR